MNGLSVTILVVCFCVVTAGLFAVIVERTNERDEARAERDQAELERDIANDLLTEIRKAGARVVRPIRDVTNVIPMQRSDSWLEQVMDEQAGWSE